MVEYVSEYHDLDGVSGGRLRGPMVHTVSGFRSAMVANRAVSSAGDHGAIMVWRDDSGQWRCSFMRFCTPRNEAVFSSKAAVLKWVREWLPRTKENHNEGA